MPAVNDSVADRVIDIIAKYFELEPKIIKPVHDLTADFGADSINVIELLAELEDEFGIEIPDEDVNQIHTVGQIIALTREKASDAG